VVSLLVQLRLICGEYLDWFGGLGLSFWDFRKDGEKKLLSKPNGSDLLVEGKTGPDAGEVFVNQKLANVLKTVAKNGKKGFYEGWVADAIIEVVQASGGFLQLQDLLNHTSTFVDPISVKYNGVDVFEIVSFDGNHFYLTGISLQPPNGQGITALIALNILKNIDLTQFKHNSPEYLHYLIEALRLAFMDTRKFVTDPDVEKVPAQELLNDQYGAFRFKEIKSQQINESISPGNPVASSETISFSVVDPSGNAISFVNSTYQNFGSGIVPAGCGFSLQNRGAGFSLKPDHLNVLAPNKRTYHTIIPGMALKDGKLYCAFNVMVRSLYSFRNFEFD
jgi:gamma-glutamyltranspeptidase/glutathione hydrolase